MPLCPVPLPVATMKQYRVVGYYTCCCASCGMSISDVRWKLALNKGKSRLSVSATTPNTCSLEQHSKIALRLTNSYNCICTKRSTIQQNTWVAERHMHAHVSECTQLFAWLREAPTYATVCGRLHIHCIPAQCEVSLAKQGLLGICQAAHAVHIDTARSSCRRPEHQMCIPQAAV